MYRFAYFFIFLLLLARNPAQGQSEVADKPAWVVGGAWQQGSVIIHSAKIRHLAGTRPGGWELNLQRQTVGTRYWQQIYRYPRLGLSFIYLDYHQPSIGKSFALSPYLSLPLPWGNKARTHLRFGTGLAYFSNYFHRQNNPANNIISATYNAVIQARLEYEYPLGRQWAMLAGLGLNHYSNGGNVKPNLGVNIATATLGINFNTNPDYQPLHREPPPFARANFLTVSTSLGIKQRNDYDPEKYVVQSIAVGASRQVNPKSAVLLGLEGFYDPSLYPRRAWDPRVKPGSQPDIRRVGMHVGHEFHLGAIAFGAQAGAYIYRPYKADAPLYQRLEMRYYLHRHAFMALGLKLHDLIKADIIEYRLGLRI